MGCYFGSNFLQNPYFNWGVLLKYQFCKNVTLEKWNSDGLNTFGQICLHFWAWLLNTTAITPKSEDKYVQKCSTCQSFIFPKWHSFKTGTLSTYSRLIRKNKTTLEYGIAELTLTNLFMYFYSATIISHVLFTISDYVPIAYLWMIVLQWYWYHCSTYYVHL